MYITNRVSFLWGMLIYSIRLKRKIHSCCCNSSGVNYHMSLKKSFHFPFILHLYSVLILLQYKPVRYAGNLEISLYFSCIIMFKVENFAYSCLFCFCSFHLILIHFVLYLDQMWPYQLLLRSPNGILFRHLLTGKYLFPKSTAYLCIVEMC